MTNGTMSNPAEFVHQLARDSQERVTLAEPSSAPATLAGPPPAPVTVIRPPRGWQFINFRELWQFRDLLYFLTWRDVKVRYKQTFLGVAWAILQPVMLMAV